ncbi:ComF family protein [Paenibacillus sp. 1P07SE]|uniref:ComF family protein n=1 Tax=Paenibacillus sp. 1P07SE TaxID=3132209 RepID=UPI0039A64ABA
MSLWHKSLHQRAVGGLRQLMSLLAPQYPACLACGRPVLPAADKGSGAAGADGPLAVRGPVSEQLCQGCLRAAAWIQPQEICCHACGRAEHCLDCPGRRHGQIVWNRSAVRYTPVMREWLAAYKYRGVETVEPLLQSMLWPLYELLAAQEAQRGNTAASPWDVVTYVPLSAARLEERGFNQAQRLAAGLAGRYRLPLASLLVRTRDSGRQSQKDRQARMQAMAGLFAPVAGCAGYLQHLHASGGKPSVRILLVDDIYTTGSTMHACAAALHGCAEVPLQIASLTWARS